MKLTQKRKELQGLVGGTGLVAGLAGLIGNFYAPSTAIVLMLGIWIIGATAVIVFTDKPD